MASDVAPLTTFLTDAFPDRERFPSGCWITRAITTHYSGRGSGEAVAAVIQSGKSQDLARRLRLEHPADRPHLPEHDRGVTNALTEAEAFAWAWQVAEIGEPDFVWEEGAPDLAVKEGCWIEAKTVRTSDFDNSEWERARDQARPRGELPMRSGQVRSIDARFARKLDSQLENALGKWMTQRKGSNLIVFYCINLDIDIDWDEAWAAIGSWIQSCRRPGVRVVACDNHRWRQPIVDTGWA